MVQTKPDLSRHRLPECIRHIDGVWRKRVYDIHDDGWVWSPLDGQREEESLCDQWIATTGMERGDPNLRGDMGDQDIYARLKARHMDNRRQYMDAPSSKELERTHG